MTVHARIPKKPLAVSKSKRNLPMELDWGPGVPKDRLRYINADEEALIKRHRTTKAARDYAGIPAYASDSASSKGVERGPDGPSGVGRGSTTTKTTSTAPSSTGGSSNLSAASASPSRAPNAAAQAASNAYNSRSVSASGSSNAPNAAAAYASSKLNATSNAIRSASQPLGGLNSGQIAPNGSYYGPKGITSLNQNARMAAARSVGFNPAPVQRTPGDAEAMGRMMMAESSSIKNQYGKPSVPGLLGVGEVIRNRMLSERFPDTVSSVISQSRQFSPYGDGSFAQTRANAEATRIAESILSGESPPTVGTSLNYGNIDTINNKPGYSSKASKAAFNAMPVEARIADARNPNTFSHSFGTIGSPSDVSFNNPSVPSGAAPVSFTAARPASMQTTIAGDPRVSMPRASGSKPTQSSSPVYSDNPMQGSQNPMQSGADLESPEVTMKRAETYGKVGSAIGTVLLGPVGGVVLGQLGKQMGSTPQRVRSSIASNPKALSANVQSINTMVEQRGGKGNPQMRVTPAGLQDVLMNPAKVTQSPEKYTTLEQTLAALAQGIDPETGKPIS